MIDNWQQIGKGKNTGEAVKLRRAAVESELGISMPHVASFTLDPEAVAGRNLENMIGVVQVPLGVAGPVRLRVGRSKYQDYLLPLATTEGALVASVSRGCKAISLAGGCEVEVEKVGVSRGPVFRVQDLAHGKKMRHWLMRNEKTVRRVAEGTSKRLHYLGFEWQQLGRSVWVRFLFDTQEAMGMNMVTKATGSVVALIEREMKVECVALSGNACVDKKVAWSNILSGRGRRVMAEVRLPDHIVESVLKTSAKKMVEVVKRKMHLGSAMHGVVGMNAQAANVVAALFLATGQDLGHVGECSTVFVDAEIAEGKGLYFAMSMPDVMVGVVGGGTELGTQKEALTLLGLKRARKGDADQLAAVLGAAVLAGELSLTAALATDDLVQAHEKLGRGLKK